MQEMKNAPFLVIRTPS